MASMATRNSVLVLDGDKVAALDLVRSFAARGLTVHVAAAAPGAIAFRSRFASTVDVCPDARTAPDAFIAWLEQFLERRRVDLVVPVTDVTAIPISRHAERLRGLAAFAVEAPEKLDLVSDKLKTLDLARRVGVPVPQTVLVRSAEDLDKVGPRFPLVCKPLRSSVWSAQGYEATSVWYAFDAQEFRSRAATALRTCPLLVQEYRKGDGVGIEVLARDGELLQVFQHRRLHELPITGGGSTYRISEAVESTLREYAARLIAALRWTGVAMVEFRVDPRTRSAVLMEINGRFWGSLPLATRAGVPFASALYDLLVLDRITPPAAYRVGLRCRRLAADVDWFKEMAALQPDARIVREGLVTPRSGAALVREAGRLALPRERYDVQVWNDPVPGLLDLLSIARAQAATLKRYAARAMRRAWSVAHRARCERRALRTAAAAQRVLFICYGNIMRSAFAAAYLERSTHGQPLEIASAGYYAKAGRPADPRMRQAARAYDVDLSTHRSCIVDPAMVARADVVFVMDRHNREALLHRFPEAADKIQFLGLLDEGAGDVEIGDPYSHSDDATRAVCRRIAAAVDRLVSLRRSTRAMATLPQDRAAAVTR